MAYLGRLMLRPSRRKSKWLPTLTRLQRNFASEHEQKTVRVGCASGFWGDTPTAAPQLIHHGKLDFLMFDYLSEITMSLLTAARAKKPDLGYAPDFVLFALGPYLNEIKRKGIRVVSNAGGINPEACAAALRQASKKAGVELKVGVVSGDDLMVQREAALEGATPTHNIHPASVHSLNAYLGAGPIARALDQGADVVVTGRCADSSMALGPLMHTFGWHGTDYDQLAAGSLAGHLIECGAQVTGGIFTDWHIVPDWHNIGFPIAEVDSSGRIVITKPAGTGGLISTGTVSEQLLYEIGDPRAYILPDVVCDFSRVQVQEVKDGVMVTGAKGSSPTDSYKVTATYMAGFKATAVCCVGGRRSGEKGRRTAEAILARSSTIFKTLGLPDFQRTHVQVLGAEDTYGPHASGGEGPREGVVWMSVQHQEKRALDLFAREIAAAGTGMAPGLTAIVGGRPKPSPLLKMQSLLVGKDTCQVTITTDEYSESFTSVTPDCIPASTYNFADQPTSKVHELPSGPNSYRLEELALTRSGDKGNSCNIGVVARHPALYPYLCQTLTSSAIAQFFAHVFPPGVDPLQYVKRYEVPGIHGLNFVLEESLGGGGVASLRSDPQGKAFAQMLLDFNLTNLPELNSICS
ncbi:hypothetical protein Pmani_019655 [Petrolisthes manimaculis]|uniref:Terpene utilization protein AtuA n=1 Tax=Petrolisthes manimaculis TaxID=1843537 RepID=A0AAE1PH86_9EUCA|nr:hypothetical protein Pmani_019655 [Petrolisthes manimaculis]